MHIGNKLVSVRKGGLPEHLLAFLSKAICWLGVMLTSALLAQAASFVAFGPKTYVRQSGKPVSVTDTFSVLNLNTQYTLHVETRRVREDIDHDSDEDDPHEVLIPPKLEEFLAKDVEDGAH